MKIKRNIVLILAAAMTMALLMTACGSPAASSSAAPAPASSAAPAPLIPRARRQLVSSEPPQGHRSHGG